MLKGAFYLPVTYDLIAVFLFGITGAMAAYRKGYDYMGIFVLALAVGAGGGIIRDTLLQNGPPAFLLDWRYLAAVFAAGMVVILAGEGIKRADLLFLLADAIGLGLYAVVGAQKSINLGLSVFAAGLIGLFNAVGGGVLRDLLSGEEPYLVQSGGQLYSLAAVLGVSVFLALGVGAKLNAQLCAFIGIGVAFVARTVFIAFDVRSKPVHAHRMRTSVRNGYMKLRRRDTDAS